MEILQRLGWTPGSGLGKERNGRIAPISVVRKTDNYCIGRTKDQFDDTWWENLFNKAASNIPQVQAGSTESDSETAGSKKRKIDEVDSDEDKKHKKRKKNKKSESDEDKKHKKHKKSSKSKDSSDDEDSKKHKRHKKKKSKKDQKSDKKSDKKSKKEHKKSESKHHHHHHRHHESEDVVVATITKTTTTTFSTVDEQPKFIPAPLPSLFPNQSPLTAIQPHNPYPYIQFVKGKTMKSTLRWEAKQKAKKAKEEAQKEAQKEAEKEDHDALLKACGGRRCKSASMTAKLERLRQQDEDYMKRLKEKN
eukprot:TRINITY_DN13399_c0_g1_i1.p1 TRINITY_DN13399_c0_g1~~TRINITY_DN13399_c0_g1_i1.p1  ORF type:complete len:306 (-),score=144.13 TRINITY_DN13399_c0_g1_i1:135-1052(-)